MKISIVSPVYRAENIVEKLVEELELTLSSITNNYEIILVDDRSPDKSWEKLKKINSANKNVKVARLSKNFGQHAAIIAGLNLVKGEWIVVMDCDLQDQPKEIVKLFKKAQEGYDIVLAKRTVRNDSIQKKLSSYIFYVIFNYFADLQINRQVANFGIYNEKVIKSVLNINDKIKFFPLFVNWVGYNSTSISVEHNSRMEGGSSYSISKLISLAFNVIISFSDKPLKLFISFGLLTSGLSFIIGLYYFTQYLLGNISEPGYTSLILSIWFLSGLVISILGVVGIYIGKTFNQTRNRPIYIFDEIKE